MADLNTIVDELSGLTVMEAAELATLLEEKWGVSAAAPVAVAVARRKKEQPLESDRSLDIEHDPAGPRRKQTVSQRRDKPTARRQAIGPQLPVKCGQIDDDTKGIGQGEDAVSRRLAHLQDKARLIRVLTDPRIGDARLGERRRSGGKQTDEDQEQARHE